MILASIASAAPPGPSLFDATLGAVLFYGFAAMAAGGGLGIVACRNIVRAAVCLLAALVGVAGLYFLLDAEFLAAVQLVVYVGGTLILIVFGVMLTSTSPFATFEPTRTEVMAAGVIAAALLACLVTAITLSPPSAPPPAASQGYAMTQLGEALLGEYLIPFELASVILLVVMIGAAYLARGRRHAAAPRPDGVGRK